MMLFIPGWYLILAGLVIFYLGLLLGWEGGVYCSVGFGALVVGMLMNISLIFVRPGLVDKDLNYAKWAMLFAFALVVTLAAAWHARESLDYAFIIIILLPLGALLTLFFALVSCVAARWAFGLRPHLIPANFGFLCILIGCLAAYLFRQAWWPQDFAHVKAYVAVAVPTLETYYEKHGHYPESLQQLGLTLPIPPGLEYIHCYDPKHQYPQIDLTPRAGNEIYGFNYYQAEYCCDGQWFVDY